MGAGIILRRPGEDSVRGMTTAAAIWVTACLGVACGIGAWRIILVAAIPLGFLLILGGPLERTLHRYFLNDGPEDELGGEGDKFSSTRKHPHSISTIDTD